MRLHDDPDTFAELVAFAAERIGLPEVYVEKDYWVTNALKHLSASPHAQYAVFKGGTSLSKAYRLIERFSEDIDLAVLSVGLSGNAIKQRIKDVETAANCGLNAIDDTRVSKGSSFRRTVYAYPRFLEGHGFGQASPHLMIEVNAFTHPEPHEARCLQSLIADALIAQDRHDLIEEYGLEPFSIQVLSIRRTLVEKLLGLIKDSYHDDPIAQLSRRIRHLYDICLILRQPEQRDFIQSEDFEVLCKVCISDELEGNFDNCHWLEQPLSSAPLFAQFPEWKASLENTYLGSFSDLVYGELPGLAEIESAIVFFSQCVPGNR